MNKASKLRYFALGMAVCLLTVTLISPATAAKLSRTAELFYRDIKIILDGETVEPQDVNGNPTEPFIIDGTTYLPVRAIAGALGVSASWNNYSSTVTLSHSLFTMNDHSEQIVGPVTDIASDDPNSGRRLVYTANGGLYRWGGVDYGNSDGPMVEKLIGVKTFSSFSISRFASCFVDANGVLWLPRGSSNEKLMEGVQTGCLLYENTGLALKTDGSVWTWRREEAPVQIMTDAGFARIFANMAYVIKNDGSLWCWTFTETGAGNNSAIPKKLMDDVSQVCYNLALKTDGSVWRFAHDGSAPQKVLNSAVMIESNGNTFAAINSRNELYLWGQVNGLPDTDGANAVISEPTLFMNDVRDVACGYEGILMLKTDGTLWEFNKSSGETQQIAIK